MDRDIPIWRKNVEYKKVKGELEEVLTTEEIKEIGTKDNYVYADPQNIKISEESISFTLGKGKYEKEFVVQKNNIEEIIVE